MTKVHKRNLLLADDDEDDCIFFGEALDELTVSSTLSIVNDGFELMQLLKTSSNKLPDLLFLDLNMPLKTGYDCLSEIKKSSKLKELPVIILSTSFDYEMVNSLYEKGAHYYIRKPGKFSALKELIQKALTLTAMPGKKRPIREEFVLNAE